MAANPLLEAYNSLQRAELLRQQRDFAGAQSMCEALLNRYPDYMGALHTLGLVFADQQRYDEALDCLVRAVMLNPQSSNTLTALCEVYLRLGAVELATTTLEQARSLKPRDATILIASGDIYRESREYELARDAYQQALGIDPGSSAAAIGLGWCHQNLGASADAAAVFEKLIHLGMRQLEPVRALANLPASVVSIDLLAALEKVVRDPSEDPLDFERSIPFFRAAALDRAARYGEAWAELAAANDNVFRNLQNRLRDLSNAQIAASATLRGHIGATGRYRDDRHPISLFILGPSGCGKTTLERLTGMLPGFKRGHENPIVENAVRRTFQSSNFLTVSVMHHLPVQLEGLFNDIYFSDLAKRAGSAKVFTNTLSTCIYDAARLISLVKNVRFVFVRRNLEDNVFRIFMRKYRPGTVVYSYNLKSAREHITWYHQMMQLMADKFPDIVRILDYEDIVARPAATFEVVTQLCDQPMPDIKLPEVVGDVGCATPYRERLAAALAADR
jgi:tetratricopeptide (TPR) repeat protein